MSFEFKDIVAQRQQLFRKQPELAQVTVTADSRLVDSFFSLVKVRDFEIAVDQPRGMGSTNKGPRPSEYVLAALAACHEVTYRLYADALGIALDSIEVSVTGHSDARGFFGPDEAIRAGFSQITGMIKIQSDATDAELERLQCTVNQHCPVLDDLTKPVPVALELVRVRD